MEVTTDSLRALAPKWSLAGDDRLLTLLQDMHQKIVTKCREVNTKLDDMASALDVASISLQNVNNKFMALSNSQFIESRVYDDDGDVAYVKPKDETQLPEIEDEVSKLKRGLAILDDAHETAEILDDSDSDSDAEISVVLKSKDLYSHRPLPYIIGSQPWKNKWHAGLVVEDSDSDSSCADVREGEQYSASEDEQTNRLAHDNTISEASSFSERDRDISRERDTLSRDRDTELKKQTPADIAAELAARLGQAPPRILEEPEENRQPVNKTVYRPQNPVPSTIFSDEPPPMDHGVDQHFSESPVDDDDDDIFAEINKNQPYNSSNKGYVDDLFGKPVEGYNKEQTKSAKQKSNLFDDESEPELFADKPQKITKEISQSSKVVENSENTVKKPVGGIPFFGSNKGTDSIGVAILNRNRRKSSTSGNESDENTIKTDTADKSNSSEETDKNNANAIFDNLFAKAKQAEQKTVKQKKPADNISPVKPKQNVKDLFSDNIFDDIDDIFTSNIKIPTKDAIKNAKSIFDDDDDLFSDIPKSNTKATITSTAISSNSNKKSIFDSDDELFRDVKSIKTNENVTKNNNVDNYVENVKESAEAIGPKVQENSKAKSKSIFDSDSDEDIFSSTKIDRNKNDKTHKFHQNINTDHKRETELLEDHIETKIDYNLKTEKAQVFQSPSLFEEDEIDELFINASKSKKTEIADTSYTDSVSEKVGMGIKNHEILGENNDKTEKNKSSKEDTRKVIDIQKPVIVDTKPYVFPKIDEPSTSRKLLIEDIDKNNIFIGSKRIETEVTNSPENIINTSQDTASVQVQTKGSSIVVEKESKTPKIDSHNNKTENVKIANENEQRLHKISEKIIPDINNELDINVEVKGKLDTIIKKNPIPAAFDDIFSEPPAFEKTKETKKSTNVNALFEDDSDDEALFFKKNDLISDEKPDLFSPSAHFAIFNDQPPALDDFKSKLDEIDDDNDIFSSVPIEESNEPRVDNWDDNTPLPILDKPQEISNNIESEIIHSQETPKLEIKTVKQKSEVSSKVVLDSDDELFSNAQTSRKNEKSDEIKDTEKKIGKLNTKNFNINVQALIPGASPKKITKEVTESNIDTKVIESVTEVDNTEPIIAKSVSFEDKLDSEILDNNLSKQRPRIQIKRRPSSRRARHEAVRKSVLVDDNTDNSSSFDESRPKPRSTNKKLNLDRELNDNLILSQDQDISRAKSITKIEIASNKTEGYNILKSAETDETHDIFIKPNDITKNITKPSFDEIDSLKSIDRTANEINKHIATSSLANSTEINKHVHQTRNEGVETKEVKSPESTTKVVYILNDEDIFCKEIPKKEIGNDDLFKNIETGEDSFKTQRITTIGNAYKEISNINPTKALPIQTFEESAKKGQSKAKSLFDLSDDDDDDLFGKSKKPIKVGTKSKLFESDSEDDLFSGKKEKVKQKVKDKDTKKEETAKEVKKLSLFGDDDAADEDLFGVKTKIASDQNKPSSSRAPREANKTTEIVFEDPLSLLE